MEKSYRSRAFSHGQLEEAMLLEKLMDSSFLSTEGLDQVSTELTGFNVEVRQETGASFTSLPELRNNDLVEALCMCIEWKLKVFPILWIVLKVVRFVPEYL